MSISSFSNFRYWLKADLQSPHIEVRFPPKPGRSSVSSDPNFTAHRAGSPSGSVPSTNSRCNAKIALFDGMDHNIHTKERNMNFAHI